MTELEQLRAENAALKAALLAVRPFATRWHERMESLVLVPFDGNHILIPEYSKAIIALYNYYRDQRLHLELLMKEALEAKE